MMWNKFKNGYVYKINHDEIFSLHYVSARANEDIKSVYKRISRDWGRGEPTFLFNAELYNVSTRAPASSVVEKGKVHAMFDGHGIAFAGNKKPVWSYKNNVNAPDYIGVYPTLIRDGKRDIRYVPPGLNGFRGRTAIGTDKDGNFYICLVADGANDAALFEVADALLAAGATDGGNLDGGGSTQWYSPKGSYCTRRNVRGYIAVWLDADFRTVCVRTVLNVRETPSVLGKCVGKLNNRDIVQVLEQKGLWCRISGGWVSGIYLKKGGGV